MGISPFSRSSCNTCKPKEREQNDTNPNPFNFTIMSVSEVNGFVVAKIRYPDCTNFEGEKVLVFRHATIHDVTSAFEIDPHFCDNDHHLSPIARFLPTPEGMVMAVRFCKAMK